jgi:hypothetical protein
MASKLKFGSGHAKMRDATRRREIKGQRSLVLGIDASETRRQPRATREDTDVASSLQVYFLPTFQVDVLAHSSSVATR